MSIVFTLSDWNETTKSSLTNMNTWNQTIIIQTTRNHCKYSVSFSNATTDTCWYLLIITIAMMHHFHIILLVPTGTILFNGLFDGITNNYIMKHVCPDNDHVHTLNKN